MPVLHEYTDGSGHYIRSSVDGQFVTFQVYESAESLLTDLDYNDGDEISWGLLEPLWERGFLYTGKSKSTTKVKSHLDERSLAGLDESEEARVKEFFEEQYRKSISVPDDIYAILEEWHNDKYSIERARDLFYQANEVERWQTSIQEFQQSSVDVIGVESSEGDPAYTVNSREKYLRCVDVRRTQKNVDLIITFRGGSEYSQGLFLFKGNLSLWKIYAPRENRGTTQWRELLEYFPSIAALCNRIPGYNHNIGQWDFREACPDSVPKDVADCLQLDWEWVTYSLGQSNALSPQCRGQVERVSSIDCGIVSTDEIRKRLVFELDGGGFQPGEEVMFRILRADGRTRATDVRVPTSRDIKASPDEPTKYRTRRSQR